jgi:hypothetical protein
VSEGASHRAHGDVLVKLIADVRAARAECEGFRRALQVCLELLGESDAERRRLRAQYYALRDERRRREAA